MNKFQKKVYKATKNIFNTNQIFIINKRFRSWEQCKKQAVKYLEDVKPSLWV